MNPPGIDEIRTSFFPFAEPGPPRVHNLDRGNDNPTVTSTLLEEDWTKGGRVFAVPRSSGSRHRTGPEHG